MGSCPQTYALILSSGLAMIVEVLYSPAVLRDLDAIWEWIAIEKEEQEALCGPSAQRQERLSEKALWCRRQQTVPSIAEIV